MTANFDTLEYVETLIESGVPDKQAKAHAHAISAIADNSLATKNDIQLVRHDVDLVKRDLDLLRVDLKGDIKGVIISIGGMIFLAVGIILTAIRYL